MPRQTRSEFNGQISLGSGRERHFGPYPLEPDSFIRLDVNADVRVYAGIFDSETYHSARSRNPGMFPFSFGSDRDSWRLSEAVARPSDYFVVLRVGVFSGSGVIEVKIETVGPDVSLPSPPTQRLPPVVGWVAKTVSTAWAIVRSKLFQASGVVAVSIVDYLIFVRDAPTNFFAALTAEGTLTLALVTAYFGVIRGERRA